MKTTWMQLLAALLLVPAVAHAQTIGGVVIEESSRVPLAGVLVELVAPDGNSAATALADREGAFLLRPGRSGRFLLQLRHIGYRFVDSLTLTVGPGEAIELELRMAYQAIPLEPLVVTARTDARLGGFYERMQRPGFGRFVSRADIERRQGATRATDLLREIPSIELVPVTVSFGTQIGNLILMRRGTGRCLPTVYLDGMVVKQFEESPLDMFLQPGMLEGIEIYTGFGSAPSALEARDGCGVVAFWTRADSGGRWSWRNFAASAGTFVVMVGLVRWLAP